ncbi:hypothetical protein [Amycolatopsis sp. NPDC021455]|uniref:hypothetical protein n=1 Tax=Amycolatopsis sp. NPDC021455 TaxID=3154901 RepID=UPI0033C28B24
MREFPGGEGPQALGRDLAGAVADPTSAYHVAVDGKTKIVGTVSGGGTIPADIAAMTKKDDGLVKALQRALDTVIKNGQYGEVLKRWNLTSEALPASEVNPPGLPRK